MKTKIALLLMSVAFALSSHAQVKFTLKGGASLANVSFNQDINDQYAGDFSYGSKVGFIGGFAVEVPLGGSKFSLQPELLFHQKGYTSKYSDSETSEDYTTTLNYLEMPVLMKFNFGKFYAAAGTYTAVGLGGKYKGTNTYMGFTAAHDGKVKFGEEPAGYNGSNSYTNAVDFGLQMGAGVKVSAITIDLRFGLGLIDIYDKQDLDTRTLNRSLQLTVGLPIMLKK